MEWWFVAGYILMFLVVGRVLYVKWDRDDPTNSENDLVATFAGLLWPLAIVVWLSLVLWRNTIVRETPRQREERLKQETDDLQQEAEKLKLPYPKEAQ